MSKPITDTNLNQSNFIQLPIALFVQEEYKDLKSNDRLVYARLFNLIQLSALNSHSYKDDKGRLFCYITQEKIADDLNIGKRTVRTCLKTLEEKGLIEREEVIINLQRKHKIFVFHPSEGKASFYH